MNNQTNKLIPELRFPEFMNDAGWEGKIIGEVFDSFSGGTPNTSEREYYNGDVPFIRSAEINKKKTELDKLLEDWEVVQGEIDAL